MRPTTGGSPVRNAAAKASGVRPRAASAAASKARTTVGRVSSGREPPPTVECAGATLAATPARASAARSASARSRSPPGVAAIMRQTGTRWVASPRR